MFRFIGCNVTNEVGQLHLNKEKRDNGCMSRKSEEQHGGKKNRKDQRAFCKST